MSVAALCAGSLLTLGMVGLPAMAVNANHGNQVVSEDPVDYTPHVMRPTRLQAGDPNPSVDAIVQVGSTIVAGGTTIESVSPAGTPGITAEERADDVAVNGLFAFDATTGDIKTIDIGFVSNDNTRPEIRSLTTDGTAVYVGGQFRIGTGNASYRRVVRLVPTGDPNAPFQLDPAFHTVPDGAVNEVVVNSGRLYIGGPFTSITTQPADPTPVVANRSALAALNPATGAVLPGMNVPFAGTYNPNNPGSPAIKKFDISSNGQKLVAVGNFATVGGQPRVQVAMLDIAGDGTASVSAWATDRFTLARNPDCNPGFDSWVSDVDFSPDGSYFVITTTGGFAGGAQSMTLCDTITRWETASTGNGPSWIDYSGGDTLLGVAVTGAAVYVGGHPRWLNNPFGGGTGVRGRGAVVRWGIAALDPVNGLPLSWNPGKSRGVGAQALFATPQGLWVGSDTTEFNGEVVGGADGELEGETHSRIAFVPLAGGSTLPDFGPATLPDDLFVAGGNALTVMKRRPVDAEGRPAGGVTDANTTVNWSSIRGAFYLDGALYHGDANGTLYRRTFNPATGEAGPRSAVNLFNDASGRRIPFPIEKLTGMFFDAAEHRIYYSVAGRQELYFRYFSPESDVVGAQTFTARRGGLSFAGVRGMTLASGRIIYGSTDGKSRSVSFADGRVTGPATVLSSGKTWNYRAIFVENN